MAEANALLLCLAKGSHMVTMEICLYRSGRFCGFTDVFPPAAIKTLKKKTHTKENENFFYVLCYNLFPFLNVSFLAMLWKIALNL